MALFRPKSAKFLKLGPSISFKIKKRPYISIKNAKRLKKKTKKKIPEMGHFSIIYRVFHKEWHFLGQYQLNFLKIEPSISFKIEKGPSISKKPRKRKKKIRKWANLK